MARRIESLFLEGEAGQIEALLEEPEHGEPLEVAVVCHPHPQFGGTMHNKVVYRLARGLRRTGCVVLRFNYRGVNLSEGEYSDGIGETEDARVALRTLQARYPGLPVAAAGFSFGARVALSLASAEPAIARVFAVGFPTRVAEREFVYQVNVPRYFFQACTMSSVRQANSSRSSRVSPNLKQLTWIQAEDHFFRGALDKFEEEVERIGVLRVVTADEVAVPLFGQPAG
ncbi:MAG: hypothetical protein M3Y72_21680 [Acidobacteriota bacterium]|nr:hypothetical protein [Acidobacteriota bacterium]